MKKSDSNNSEKKLEKEFEKLLRENAKLKAQKEADKAELKRLKKELKKKDAPKLTLTEEQRQQLLNLFRNIDSLFS